MDNASTRYRDITRANSEHTGKPGNLNFKGYASSSSLGIRWEGCDYLSTPIGKSTSIFSKTRKTVYKSREINSRSSTKNSTGSRMASEHDLRHQNGKSYYDSLNGLNKREPEWMDAEVLRQVQPQASISSTPSKKSPAPVTRKSFFAHRSSIKEQHGCRSLSSIAKRNDQSPLREKRMESNPLIQPSEQEGLASPTITIQVETQNADKLDKILSKATSDTSVSSTGATVGSISSKSEFETLSPLESNVSFQRDDNYEENGQIPGTVVEVGSEYAPQDRQVQPMISIRKPIFQPTLLKVKEITNSSQDKSSQSMGAIHTKNQSIQRKSYKSPIERRKISRMEAYFKRWLLEPAYDNKGEYLESELEHADVYELSFADNGLHPKSRFNTIWDLFTTLTLMFVLWLVPLLAAFAENDDDIRPWSIAITILFVLDSVVAAVTPISKVSSSILCSVAEYEEKRPSLSDWIREWVMREALLAIITTIPFDVIFPSWRYSSLLILIRLIRVLKLGEISSKCAILHRWWSLLDRATDMSVSQTIPIAFGMMTFIHINACEMYFFGKMSEFDGWEIAFTDISSATLFDFYAWTFLQGVSHMFPNSFLPQTATEQLLGAIFVILAAVLYACFIGAISNAVMSKNPAGRLFSHKMEQLNDYVKWKNLAPETEKKLFKFYEIKYRGKYFDEDLLLAEMNESLRAEICLENTRDLIDKVPFLRRNEKDGRDEIFIGRIATALHPQYYVKGDYITKQGDAGMDMFFLHSGKLDVFVNDRKVVSLYDGAYIGEVALISHVLRTASVQTAKASVLYRLSKTDFHLILEDFDDMKVRIQRLAEERVQALLEKR
ncbi:hypothetical protein BC830DRAFT_902868 [Chytriomyces sp. MP71]|nr:hypothetical protein BC830DRAFT_902868 [Chytriomyces sp. MP71]